MNKKFLISCILLGISGCNKNYINDPESLFKDGVDVVINGRYGNQQTSNVNNFRSSCQFGKSNRQMICETQELLNRKGYNVGSADGRSGKNTKRGIRSYQRDNRLAVTGEHSSALLSQLKSAPAQAEEFNTLKDFIYGAGACGVVAALLGQKAGTVAIAAAACGTANATVTELAKRGKRDYAEKYNQITSDMAESEKQLDQINSETQLNKNKTSNYKNKVDQLISTERNDRQFIAKANELRDQLDSQIRKNKKSLSIAEAKLIVLDDQISEIDTIIKDSPDIKDIDKTKLALNNQKSRLIKTIKDSNNVETILVAQKNKLDSEIIERS